MSLQREENHVLLVHGIHDTRAVFQKMAAHLGREGWLVSSLDLEPNDGRTGLDRLAEQLRDFADRNLPRDRRFCLVGFSMGGIVSRYYVQKLGGGDRVKHFITISSPHHGTQWAYFSPNVGVRQMRPNSDFLNELNQDISTLQKIHFTSIWTPRDLTIVPASSSRMKIGRSIEIPVFLHPWMLTDRRSIEAVARELAATRNEIVEST